MSKYASITLSFDHFHFHPTAQLVPDLILTLCQTKIAERESFYHSDFLSCASPPLQFWTTSDGDNQEEGDGREDEEGLQLYLDDLEDDDSDEED